MAARKKRNSAFGALVTYIILPLTLIDGYAFYKVHKSSEHWLSGMLSFSEPLSQLAIILAINIAVIIILLIYIAHNK